MTSLLTDRPRSRWAGALVATTVLAASLVGAGAAHAGTAGTFSQQHVDAVHVSLSPTAKKLILGSNREDATVAPEDGYYLGSEVDATSSLTTPAYDFTVNKWGSIWQIPKDRDTAANRGVVFAGFAGLGDDPADPDTRYLQQHGTSSPDAARSLFYDADGLGTVPSSSKIRQTVTLVSSPAGSTATIDWSGVAGVTASGAGTSANPYVFDFSLTSGEEEAFHRHAQWDFSAAGTYVFKVVASVQGSNPSGIAASDPVYYRFVAAS